jgi:cobaltochelatase CobN
MPSTTSTSWHASWWHAAGPVSSPLPAIIATVLPQAGDSQALQVLAYIQRELLPNLARTHEEIDNLLRGLAGGYVPAGPSGAPTRGMAHILPTGRNFYSVDPRGLPSQAAWQVGSQLANEMLARHRKETGQYPESVSISVWGTSAMRTHGDDIAEILALLGVRPRWQAESRRVAGIEVIPLAELGRPRIDVTVRISGFFRDAFPQLIALVDDAVQAVAMLDEDPADNYLRKHYLDDMRQQLLQALPDHAAEPALLHLRRQARQLRRRYSAADQRAELADRRRLRHRLPQLGRLCLWPQCRGPMRATRCAIACPAWKWHCTIRTIANTTSSTATTTCSTTAA